MKKYLLYMAMCGFSALAITVGFTACSEDATVDNEPSVKTNTVEEPKEVNVNFVMNVDYGQPATTRQSAETVQIPSATSNTFRGMENATLLPYTVAGATFLTEANASSITAARKFDMSKLYTSAMVDNTGTNNSTSSSRRIIELPVPLQSTLMLVYGKAIKGTSTTEDMDAKEGKIVMNIQENASATDFSLVQRLKGEKVNEYKMAERLTAFMLNRVLHSRVYSRTEQVYTFNATHDLSGIIRAKGKLDWDYGAGNTPGALSWSDLGDAYAAYKAGTATLDMTPLEESLAEAFYNLTQVAGVSGSSAPYTPGEYRAGSAEAVARTMYDLYMICSNVYNATPTQNAEADAMRLASRIGHQIFGFYGIDGTNKKANLRAIGDAATTTSTIRYFIQTQQATGTDPSDPIVGVNDADFSTSGGKFYGLTDPVLRSFPGCFGLPKGAAQLAYEKPSATSIPATGSAEAVTDGAATPSEVNQFVYHYMNQPFVTEMTTTTPSFDPEHYMYPAELAYFVNSSLLVNNTALAGQSETAFDALFPNGTQNWDDTSKWGAGWTEGPVLSTTNTIAVKKNINYGVAMLKTTVATSNAALDDNRAQFKPGEPANKINVSGLRLVGILIGGQDNHVDWQYLPKDAAHATYVIYDNVLGTFNATAGEYDGIQIPSSGTSAANYTIVFDNYDKTIAAGNKQKSVKFALEFRNDGTQDFWGEDNLIRQGGTFYIKGEMSIPDDTSGIAWDTYYQVPPLWQTDTDTGIPTGKKAGDSTQKPRVFIQDHVTEANITLGPNALKHAVVSVPDLRSSQTSLGLSVDLTWSQGLTFNPVIGN